MFLYFCEVPINCVVSQWSKFTPANEAGVSYRSRYIKVHPLNGGKACPPLTETKKGKL